MKTLGEVERGYVSVPWNLSDNDLRGDEIFNKGLVWTSPIERGTSRFQRAVCLFEELPYLIEC